MEEKNILKNLVDSVDLIISQHAIYINQLEKALKENKSFNPTSCHECKFGKLFDNEVAPYRNNLSTDIKELIEIIETKHCKFHETVKNLLDSKDENERKDYLESVKNLSTELFVNLLKLKNRYKKLYG